MFHTSGPPPPYSASSSQQPPPPPPEKSRKRTFQLHETEITDVAKGTPICSVTKTQVPRSLTKRPLLTLTRSDQKEPFATIKFKSVAHSIDLTINGHETILAENVWAGIRFFFAPTALPSGRWCWSEGSYGFRSLTDQLDKEKPLAALKKDVLELEDGVDDALVDDVLVSAVAVWWKDVGMDVGKGKFAEMTERWGHGLV